ncbi:hypothetical protein M9H77_04380 [Catharanthus roseus]|uniref:Uncharacterized protein n=1 Tax=Catharanthus roseus TaxID=4058 RepID=A0ACC0CDX6_CATRO|nr:hypothetical protein M9H77_04380 [Catharanthus roseus]
MDPNLWNVQMTMRVPSYYEVHPPQWESSQWFNSARYDYTHSGAFLDMGSGSPIDDLVESVCRENGSRTDTYVSKIYSRQTYRRTYQANFHPVLSENFWRDVPFSLTFYPPNMKKERGRK